jgi:MOSC domain-containing protein YiiM
MALLSSLQVGHIQTFPGDESRQIMTRTWTTAFYKMHVDGPVEVTSQGLVGDAQADLRVHGGPDKAIMTYSADHFLNWKAEIELDVVPGGFGENLTISGWTEKDVCIGDQWQIGNVVLEVSQPRQPCWKLARRWMMPELPKQVIKTGRSGWYLRVLTMGELAAPCPIHLLAQPHPEWTIERVNRVYYEKVKSRAELEALANLPELAAVWQEDFQGMLSMLED